MDLNRVRFKNGGMYLDGTKIQGVQKYELTDGINELGTLKLELLVDGSELFKEQSDDSEVSLVLDGITMAEVLKNRESICVTNTCFDC